MADKSILLVEDNPDDVELTLRALRHNGILNPVHVARDGAEAIDWLFGAACHAEAGGEGGRPHGPPPLPAVVLLDLQLPAIDGFEVLRRIRAHERTRYLPVVILSSSREDADLERSYREGASSYVRKPVDFTDFLDATRHLGHYWLSLNEVPAAR